MPTDKPLNQLGISVRSQAIAVLGVGYERILTFILRLLKTAQFTHCIAVLLNQLIVRGVPSEHLTQGPGSGLSLSESTVLPRGADASDGRGLWNLASLHSATTT